MICVRRYILFNKQVGERKAAEKNGVHLMKGPWDKNNLLIPSDRI